MVTAVPTGVYYSQKTASLTSSQRNPCQLGEGVELTLSLDFEALIESPFFSWVFPVVESIVISGYYPCQGSPSDIVSVWYRATYTQYTVSPRMPFTCWKATSGRGVTKPRFLINTMPRHA